MTCFDVSSSDALRGDASKIAAGAQDATEQPSAGDARREALRKIGKFSAYAAPAMLAVSSANAGPVGSG